MHLKILHLRFGLTTLPINTLCSQKRLTERESALPLWDTDAYGTWFARPGGYRGESMAELSFWVWDFLRGGGGLQKDLPELSSWQVKWAGRSSPNMASAKKPSRKTFSAWLPAESKSYTPPWSLNQNRLREKHTNHSRVHLQTVFHASVCAARACGSSSACVSVLTHGIWKQMRQKDREQVTHQQ